jgi:predicted amidohydrolase YtcJ
VTKADVEKAHKGTTTKTVDAGRTLVPGLMGGHAHVAQFGTQAIGANLLAAPDGHVETIDDLVAEMKKAIETQDASPAGSSAWATTRSPQPCR